MNSNEKGKRGERELAAYLRAAGFPEARRGQQYCGLFGNADVVGLPGFHIECKRKERLNISDAMYQSQDDSSDGEISLVMHRKNHEDWMCTLWLDDFLRLVNILYDCGGMEKELSMEYQMKVIERLTGGDEVKSRRILDILYEDI